MTTKHETVADRPGGAAITAAEIEAAATQTARLERENEVGISRAALAAATVMLQPPIALVGVKAGELIVQPVSYQQIPVYPYRNARLDYLLFVGDAHSGECLITARIDDGVHTPVHQKAVLPPHDTQAPGSITFEIASADNHWTTPFPESLYGAHRAYVECWIPDPQGKALPAASQISPPDTRTFTLLGSDSHLLAIEPGCRSDVTADGKGLEYATLDPKDFTLTPNQVTLNDLGNGKYAIAPGQQTTVAWRIGIAPGLAPTAYGYRGGFRGVTLTLPDGTMTTDPQPVGSRTFKVGHTPWNNPVGFHIALSYGDGCGFQPLFRAYARGTVAAVAAVPAQLGAIALPPPAAAVTGVPFTVQFNVINTGGTATPPVTVDLQVEEALSTQLSQSLGALMPGAGKPVPWTLQLDVPGDYHIACYLTTNGVKLLASQLDVWVTAPTPPDPTG